MRVRLMLVGSNIGALLGPPIIAGLVASAGWPAGLFLHWRERRKVHA